VTQLADDVTNIQEIVYEMCLDEVTAGYGQFGGSWIRVLVPNHSSPIALA
jgi:chlorite dismutase